MIASATRLFVLGSLSVLAACGDLADEPAGGDPDAALNMQPEILSPSQTEWFVLDGGIAENNSGLVIDIADGGSLSRFVERVVNDEASIELVINLDANGDQIMQVELIGGCGRRKADSGFAESLSVKNGFNRLSAAHRFDASYDCFSVTLSAPRGPVSVFIEDATIYWKE